MTQSWSDFEVVDTRPLDRTHWQLPDNGWFAIFMWAAGPRWVSATKDRTQREPVRHVDELPDGSLSYMNTPFTAEDQEGVDQDLDESLAHVGLPPRPRGFDWYLRIDFNRRERISQIGSKVEAAIPLEVDGADYLPAVKAAMERIVPAELTSISQ